MIYVNAGNLTVFRDGTMGLSVFRPFLKRGCFIRFENIQRNYFIRRSFLRIELYLKNIGQPESCRANAAFFFKFIHDQRGMAGAGDLNGKGQAGQIVGLGGRMAVINVGQRREDNKKHQ